MSDKGIVANIIAKKFTKANAAFTDLMRTKVLGAIQDFKKDFKYVTHDQVTDTNTKAETDG